MLINPATQKLELQVGKFREAKHTRINWAEIYQTVHRWFLFWVQFLGFRWAAQDKDIAAIALKANLAVLEALAGRIQNMRFRTHNTLLGENQAILYKLSLRREITISWIIGSGNSE